MYDGPTYFAWFVLVLLSLIGVGLVVWIGSLPGDIAKRRNHPQADAINALSWLGLLFGGAGWVVAFVWALYRPSNNHAASLESADSEAVGRLEKETRALRERVAALESQLAKSHREGSKA
jgi:type VI protein secretion system component VasK